MNDRTLVKVSAGENCIGFKTVSRRRKSGREYLVMRDELARLEDNMTVVTNDIHSYASLRRNAYAGTLTIDFTWLSGSCDGEVLGWEETVTLPYDALMAFVRDSAQEGGTAKWKHLSLRLTARPKLVFHDRERLRECLANRMVRKKLSHALRDNFHYPYVERIEFYHDFAPYSFLFREVRNGRDGVVGGFIFHSAQGDLRKATYSVHT